MKSYFIYQSYPCLGSNPVLLGGPGKRYTVYPKSSYWGAISNCRKEGQGGTLACPRNPAQQAAIKALISADSWIGVTDMVQEGTFKCSSGDVLEYLNWEYKPMNMVRSNFDKILKKI